MGSHPELSCLHMTHSARIACVTKALSQPLRCCHIWTAVSRTLFIGPLASPQMYSTTLWLSTTKFFPECALVEYVAGWWTSVITRQCSSTDLLSMSKEICLKAYACMHSTVCPLKRHCALCKLHYLLLCCAVLCCAAPHQAAQQYMFAAATKGSSPAGRRAANNIHHGHTRCHVTSCS